MGVVAQGVQEILKVQGSPGCSSKLRVRWHLMGCQARELQSSGFAPSGQQLRLVLVQQQLERQPLKVRILKLAGCPAKVTVIARHLASLIHCYY
jgi:hypothetical protein